MATASPKVPLLPLFNNRTKRKITFAEIEDAQYKGYRTLVSPDPTKLSVEYLSNLSPKSLRLPSLRQRASLWQKASFPRTTSWNAMSNRKQERILESKMFG